MSRPNQVRIGKVTAYRVAALVDQAEDSARLARAICLVPLQNRYREARAGHCPLATLGLNRPIDYNHPG